MRAGAARPGHATAGTRGEDCPVAIIEDGMEDKRRVARVNGMPAMGLAIRKIRGAKVKDVSHGRPPSHLSCRG